MKIVVLVKQVPDTYEQRKLDTVTGLLDRSSGQQIVDEIGERATEVALRYKDSNKDTEVVLLSMGPESVSEALRKGLALGADAAVHVLDSDLSGADLARTATVLAAAVTKSGYDLIIAGNESTDGRGGVVPAMLAEHLGIPHLTFLDSIDISEDRVDGVRATESGSVTVHAGLPAIVSVTERSPEVRFPNFKGILSAKKKPLTVLSLEDLDLASDALADGGHSLVASTSERPARVSGTKVIDEGTAGVDLADFLATRHLI